MIFYLISLLHSISHIAVLTRFNITRFNYFDFVLENNYYRLLYFICDTIFGLIYLVAPVSKKVFLNMFLI